jgi:hypothetical protein
MMGPSDSSELSRAGCYLLCLVLVAGALAFAALQFGGAWLVDHFH